jgi:hypothetical protein
VNTLDHAAGTAHGSKGQYYIQTTGAGRSPTTASTDRIPQDQKRRQISRARQSEPPKKKPRTNDNSPDILQHQKQTRGSKSTKLALENVDHSVHDLTSSSTPPSEWQRNVHFKDFQTSQDETTTSVRPQEFRAEWALNTSTAKAMKKITSGPVMIMSDDDKEEQFTKDATRQRHRAEHGYGIMEVRRSTQANGPASKTGSASIPLVQRQVSDPDRRIEVLDEIFPDEMLLEDSADRSSPDIIQQDVPIPGTEPTSSRRSKTILADVRSYEPPQARARKTSGDYETPRDVKLFRLKRVYFHAAVNVSGYVLVVDKSARTFSLDYDSKSLSNEALVSDISVDRVHRVIHGEKCSKVKMFTSEIRGLGHEILLELNSHRLAIDLAKLLSTIGKEVNVEVREDLWLDKVFGKIFDKVSTTRCRVPGNPENMSHISPYFTVTDTRNASGQQDRRKSDHANSEPSFGVFDGSNAGSEPRRRRSAVSRRQQMMQTDLDERAAPRDLNHSSRALEDPAPRSRTTRISSTLQPSPPPPPTKYSQTGKLGEPWQNPLTYPRSGRKRATVNFEDLARLDDDEFLNDNLIAFFLRYLEHYLEQDQPDMSKKAHFFNSYFYEKLRQKSKDKKSVINYEGVKKWTDKIGLFNRDFIIVPVNENLHWYVAIICNLSWFKLDKAEQDALDEAEMFESSLTAERQDIDESANDTQQSLQELSLEDRERQGDILRSDLVPETSTGSTKKKRRKRKSEPHLKGVNSYRPTIITLDSLNLPRYAAVSVLKHYIVQEASVRLNKEIDSSDIQGLSAKKIPTQNNYSDCGLYVCAYLERFAMAPRSFIEQELRRMPQQWPELRNHDLRGRMRDFLLNLHKIEGGKASNVAIPKVGEILLPPVEYMQLDASLKDEAVHVPLSFPTASYQLLSREAELHETQNQISDSGDELEDVTSDQGAGHAYEASDPTSLKARTAKILSIPTMRHSEVVPKSVSELEELSPPFFRDDPSAMASRIREERSPHAERMVRSGSVSTEYLHGTESYENTDQQMLDDG